MNRTMALILASLTVTGIAAAQTSTSTTPGGATTAQARSCTSYYVPYGKLEYANAQYSAAFAMFRYCTLLEPKNLDALYLLARTEVQLELFTTAIEHVTDVLKVDPKNTRAYVVLAQAYTDQWRKATDRRPYATNMDKALGVLDDAQKIAEKNGDKAAIWNQRGLIYKYRSDFDKSLAAFHQASHFSPDDSTILFNLGALQINLNQMTESIATLHSAVDLNPNDYTTRAFLAKVLIAHGDFTEAKSQASQAYRIASAARKDPFVVGEYGMALYLNKDLSGGRSALESATKLVGATDYPENFYYLGRVYLDLGLAKEARDALSKATFLPAGSREPTYWLYLGRSNEANGLKDDARKAYQQALKLKPDFKEATTALGNLGK